MATRFLKAQNGGIYKDSNGKPIVVDLSLPALSNPATAEDIASGKEAINADGVVVTGTAEMVENKLPLIVGTQSADNLYDITASDIKGVSEIKQYSFYAADGLRSIELPTTCTSIGNNAFQYCSSLTSASMPNVTSIGSSAFSKCRSLTSANMPNVTNLGNSAFTECDALTSANMPNATSIGNNAFQYCDALASVEMPNATSIGSSAFQTCSVLTSVDMPNVTSIGGYAFRNCFVLTSVDMPNVTSIGNYAVADCSALTSVNMPKVTSIGGSAFRDCLSLTSLTIPSTCTSIGNYALQCGSSSNKCTFTFEGTTPPSIQSNTFTYINKIIVPVGCGETYKTATNWTTFASYIEEATA